MPLTGEEKAALESLADGEDTLPGWISRQSLTVLYSCSAALESMPSLPPTPVIPPDSPDPSAGRESGKPDASRSKGSPQPPTCVPPSWRTYNYYDRSSDWTLVQVMQSLCHLPGTAGEDRCSCCKKWLEHHWSWSCSGLQVQATLQLRSREGATAEYSSGAEAFVEMRAECSVCHATGASVQLKDGAL